MCFGTAFATCEQHEVNRAISFLLVFIETANRTLIAGLFYLISLGWGILRFDACPLETIRCVRFISVVFIGHCLLSVTVGLGELHLFVRIVVVVVYAYAAFICFYYSQRRLEILEAAEHSLNIRGLLDRVRPAIRLKQKMLKTGNQLGVGYALAIIASYNVNWYICRAEDVLQRSPDSLTQIVIVKEICEYALIVGLYLTLRPRVWPSFFFS